MLKRLAMVLAMIVLAGPAWAFSDAERELSNRREFEKLFQSYLPKAKKGEADAQCSLGVMYAKGEGVAQNHQEALKWFRLSAAQGNAHCQSNLGAMYLGGRGLPQDLVAALAWLRVAVRAESEDASRLAGNNMMALTSQMKPGQVEEMKRRAEKGEAGAQFLLGWLQVDESPIHPLTKDLAAGVKWLRRSAEQGFASAMLELGSLYKEGRGVPKDQAQAWSWLELAQRSADKWEWDGGVKVRAFDEQRVLAAGLGPAQEAKAKHLYAQMLDARTAAQLAKVNEDRPQDPEAAVEAAEEAYRKGDHQKALALLRPLAEQGNAKARFILAMLHAEGAGVPKDPEAAARWLRLSAEQGHAPAQVALAGALQDGDGAVKKDPQEAVKWYRRAVDQGDQVAAFNLAAMYKEGEKITKDRVQAQALFKLAAALAYGQPGSEEFRRSAQGHLADLAGEMSEWEKEQANWELAKLIGELKTDLPQAAVADSEPLLELPLPPDWTPAMKKPALGRSKDIEARFQAGWEAFRRGGFQTALGQWRALAEEGDARSEFMLGLLYRNGLGLPKSLKDAAKWLRLSAGQNYSPAQGELGGLYRFGEGVKKDPQEAVKWYRRAADQGDDSAWFNLATMYSGGEEVPRDLVRAHAYYSLSAALAKTGPKAKAGKAVDHATPNLEALATEMSPAQLAQAKRLYAQMAAKFKDRLPVEALAALDDPLIPQAQKPEPSAPVDFQAGMDAYSRQDYPTAFNIWRPLAEGGNPKAQHALATLYHQGQGVPKDYSQALKWYRLSAEQGYAPARNNLAAMYQHGLGVKTDQVQAYAWFALAAETADEIGKPVAEDNLKVLAAKMTPAQMAQARRLIRQLGGKVEAVAGPSPTGPAAGFRDIPKGQQAGKFDVAVIVGNKHYRTAGVPEVSYALRDLALVKAYLVHALGFPEENIIECRDATKGVLETVFGSDGDPKGQLYNWVKPGQSRVFVYYVGHGAPDATTGKAFLVPTDAHPDYVAKSGFPLSVLYANLAQVPAREMIVVLDACFSGQTPKGFLLKNVSPALLRVQGVEGNIGRGVVMLSAKADQLSTWHEKERHSLFTFFFLQGLSGEADQNKDGSITAAEMEKYLAEQVPYWARRFTGRDQEPQILGRKEVVLVRLTGKTIRVPEPEE